MVAINEELMPGAEQPLPVGNYYLLQDTLYRAAALTNSSGAVEECRDCDAFYHPLQAGPICTTHRRALGLHLLIRC